MGWEWEWRWCSVVGGIDCCWGGGGVEGGCCGCSWMVAVYCDCIEAVVGVVDVCSCGCCVILYCVVLCCGVVCCNM